MALIKCSECGKEISDKAKVCMNCGCPIQQMKLDNHKEYNQLTKKEKKIIIKSAIKEPTYIIFNGLFCSFLIFLTIIMPPLLALFITTPTFIVLGIIDNFLIKKYYKENIFNGESKKKDIKDIYKYLILAILIIYSISTLIYIFKIIKDFYPEFNYVINNDYDVYGYVIPKESKIGIIAYQLSLLIKINIPFIELWLLFFYKRTNKGILKGILYLTIAIGLIRIIICNHYARWYYSTHYLGTNMFNDRFAFYSVIITLMCLILANIKIKKNKSK